MEQLCTAGGLRVAPEREALRVFVESISALNGTTVAQRLEEKLVRVLLAQVNVLLWRAPPYSMVPPSCSAWMRTGAFA